MAASDSRKTHSAPAASAPDAANVPPALDAWPCLTARPEGCALAVKVQPNAPRSAAAGLVGDRLKVRIQAPAVEGKANEALRKWAAAAFGLRLQEVEILQGEKSTTKTLLLRGLARPAAIAALERTEKI